MAKLDLGKVVPIKGEDYFTNSEIEEIKNDIEQEIKVPTKTSDLTNDSGFIDNTVNNLTNYTLGVETGSSIDLSLDSSTYVMTLSLKNSDGTVLNTKTVDLPLESVVVDGDYDSTNKKIILTLESGSTIDVPVGDLINGLQSEITSNNKLSSDLVDDTNNTNKFVTSAEKTTWNGKQDTLTFDSTPTENSTNPVTSDGIFQALAGAGGGGSLPFIFSQNAYETGFNVATCDVGYYKFNGMPNSTGVKLNYDPNNVYNYISMTPSMQGIIDICKFKEVDWSQPAPKYQKETYAYARVWNRWDGSILYYRFYKAANSTTARYTSDNEVTELVSKVNPGTITGILTFNTLPETSVTPTTDNQFVNKSYVDAQIQALREELSGE